MYNLSIQQGQTKVTPNIPALRAVGACKKKFKWSLNAELSISLYTYNVNICWMKCLSILMPTMTWEIWDLHVP